MDNDYIELENTSSVNTNVAIGDDERVINTPTRYAFWNSLIVTNRDVVDIRLYLDGNGDALPPSGRIFDVPANSIFSIEPSENIFFSTINQENLGAVAETAGAIRFRAANAVKR